MDAQLRGFGLRRVQNLMERPANVEKPIPPIPVIGPYDLALPNTNSLVNYAFTFDSDFGYMVLRVVGLKGTAAASNLAATIDGSPMTMNVFAEDPGSGNGAAAIFTAGDVGAGTHDIVITSSNLGRGAIRIGDVIQWDDILSSGSTIDNAGYWEIAISLLDVQSDFTMAAVSNTAISYPVVPDYGIDQWSSLINSGTPEANTTIWYGHVPPGGPGYDYYLVYPRLPSKGILVGVEINQLKPIYLDIQKVIQVQDAVVEVLANGNYRCTVDPGSSIRFLIFLAQLLGGQAYNVSFTVVSLTGLAAYAATWDWCDGTDGAPNTVPATPQPLTVGPVSATISRPTYTDSMRFLDIENSLDPQEDDWLPFVIVITPPIFKAIKPV